MDKPNFHFDVVEENKNGGTYVLTPLPRGYGYTIGNVLRRVLLSSLEGAAITYVKVKGASHPFTTIKGLKEDVLNFILNLKQVRFKFAGEDEQKLVLKKKGTGKITGADIEDSSLCKVVNKDLYLGELASDGSLEIELFVNKGVGYEPSEEKEVREFGVLPLDSIFTPVTNVAISVEGTRVGRKSNYDKVTLKIVTDGSVNGTEALKEAGKILVSYFNLLIQGGAEKPVETTSKEETARMREEKDGQDTMMVDELDLPTRVINALIRQGIETVKQLSEMKDEDFAQIRGLGKKSIEELKMKLKELKIV